MTHGEALCFGAMVERDGICVRRECAEYEVPDKEGGISQETLDTLVDTIEAIRQRVSELESALRRVITALGSLEGE